jgi:ABC-2 type transport system permease protein
LIDFFRAARAETRKLRRTLALWAAILVPLLVIVMTTALNLFREVGPRVAGGPAAPWDSLMLNLVLFLWCLLGLPLFIALETALLAGLEHRENTWKHLFALAIPRWSIYAAKLAVGFLLVCLSSVVVGLGIAVEGMTLYALRPDQGLAPPIPWADIFVRTFSLTLAALLVLALQTWVALRWRSFVVPVGVGIAGTIAALVVGISARTQPFALLLPWSLPYATLTRDSAASAQAALLTTASLIGLLGGSVVAILGGWDIVRRDVS